MISPSCEFRHKEAVHQHMLSDHKQASMLKHP
jgi:hypothetical protein